MESWTKPELKPVLLVIAASVSLQAGSAVVSRAANAQAGQQPAAQTPAAARPVGTIKSISGNTITLTTDAGTDVTVQIQDATKLVRITPGQKDLKDATPIQLADVQPGDRVLVRGKLADDGKSVVAASLIAMKKADIAEKQTREREEWQRNGLGGLVSGVDAATGTISVSLPAVGEKKTVAKPAPFDQIRLGDQLRARGTRSADGTELAADEIVSGTFRNIAGTISAIDASAGSITLQDLASKKTINVKVTAESQLRKLPQPMAQRIAMRLKGNSPDAQATAAAPRASASAANPNAAQPARPNGPPAGDPGQSGAGGMGRSGGGGAADLQQAISRMPAATLADLQKGDAVMIVATEGGSNGVSTVITLLGGVEPILEASPKSSASSILSPWSLGSAAGGEAATP